MQTGKTKSSVDCFIYFSKLQDAKALRATKVSEPQSATTKVGMDDTVPAYNAKETYMQRKRKTNYFLILLNYRRRNVKFFTQQLLLLQLADRLGMSALSKKQMYPILKIR